MSPDKAVTGWPGTFMIYINLLDLCKFDNEDIRVCHSAIE